MTENNQQPLANGQDNTAQLVLQKLYTKNVSFEAPTAPEVFREPALRDPAGQQMELNLQQTIKELEAGLFDINLSVTVTCKFGEQVAYLVEVEQCGVFALSGFPQEQLGIVLNTYCPNVLFPYARQVVSQLVSSGGFPPFLLQPINFEQLYAEQARRRQEGESQIAQPVGHA